MRYFRSRRFWNYSIALLVFTGICGFLVHPVLRSRSQQNVARELEQHGATVGVRYSGPHWLFRFASDDCRAKYEEASGQSPLLPSWLRKLTGAAGVDPYIEVLDVADCVWLYQSEDVSKQIALLPGLPTVHTIQIDLSRDSQSQQPNWDQLSRLPRLQFVVLRSPTSVDDVLASLKECHALLGIYAYEGDFRDQSKLNPLIDLTNSTVDLASDSGIANLRELTQLRDLKIHGKRITAACLPFLRQLTSLRRVDLSETALDEQDILDLESQFPGLKTNRYLKDAADPDIQLFNQTPFGRNVPPGVGGMF